MYNIYILLFVFSAVKHRAVPQLCSGFEVFPPFLIQVKFLDIETFYGKSEKSSGDCCLCCSGMYPGVRGLLVCLEQGLISQAVAAAGPRTQHFCLGIVAGDGQTWTNLDKPGQTWLYPATGAHPPSEFDQFTQKGQDEF